MIHKKEMADRPCPNGWSECTCCAYKRECVAGLYHGDPILVAAKIAEQTVSKQAVESANSIKQGRDLEREFMLLTPDQFMDMFYSWKVPHINHKEPIPLDGPSAPGGGSKSRIPKKPLKKTPEYMKFLGM